MVKVIEANSVILGSKSEYFGAILNRGQWTKTLETRGQWAESQHKVVKVDMASEAGE